MSRSDRSCNDQGKGEELDLRPGQRRGLPFFLLKGKKGKAFHFVPKEPALKKK